MGPVVPGSKISRDESAGALVMVAVTHLADAARLDRPRGAVASRSSTTHL